MDRPSIFRFFRSELKGLSPNDQDSLGLVTNSFLFLMFSSVSWFLVLDMMTCCSSLKDKQDSVSLYEMSPERYGTVTFFIPAPRHCLLRGVYKFEHKISKDAVIRCQHSRPNLRRKVTNGQTVFV